MVLLSLVSSINIATTTWPTIPPTFWPPAPPSPRVAPKKGAPRPHIILHLTDDQGWANVGYHNPAHVITPTMDHLATKEGIRFERHYAFQWCAPSRASLMTGRESYHVLQGTHRAPAADGEAAGAGAGPGALPTAVTRGMTMLPRKLQSVGYTTHQIGKVRRSCLSPTRPHSFRSHSLTTLLLLFTSGTSA